MAPHTAVAPPDAAPTSGEVFLAGALYVPPATFVDGDVITYTVAALDTWGEGPESRRGTVTVAAAEAPADTGEQPPPPPPEEEEETETGGCASAPAAPTALGAALAAVLLLARRRSP